MQARREKSVKTLNKDGACESEIAFTGRPCETDLRPHKENPHKGSYNMHTNANTQKYLSL